MRLEPNGAAYNLVDDNGEPMMFLARFGGLDPAKFNALVTVLAAAPALLTACKAFVAAYDAQAWPIENDVGLFSDARAAIDAAEERG